jgi:hypothetical protein
MYTVGRHGATDRPSMLCRSGERETRFWRCDLHSDARRPPRRARTVAGGTALVVGGETRRRCREDARSRGARARGNPGAARSDGRRAADPAPSILQPPFHPIRPFVVVGDDGDARRDGDARGLGASRRLPARRAARFPDDRPPSASSAPRVVDRRLIVVVAVPRLITNLISSHRRASRRTTRTRRRS